MCDRLTGWRMVDQMGRVVAEQGVRLRMSGRRVAEGSGVDVVVVAVLAEVVVVVVVVVL